MTTPTRLERPLTAEQREALTARLVADGRTPEEAATLIADLEPAEDAQPT